MENTVLKLDGITHSYQDNRLFKPVTIEIHKGDRIFITGPNGKGKTTLLNIMSERLTPSEGHIQINSVGKNNYVPAEQAQLFSKLTGIENIEVFGELLKVEYKNKLEKWKANTTFNEALITRYDQCSRGMRYLLKFFILTLKECDVIFLDEPLSSLDNENKEFLLNILSKEFKEKTIVIATHFKELFPFEEIKEVTLA